ncbi:MAG: N-6 DNA methylase [Elainella sp. Prado103]|jgi:predicted helicase|nr:N-6 DNA methylase [Elainella sp. Prado103]
MSRLLVTQYQAEVEKIIRHGGSKKETSIRNAFERLLNDYCKPRNYLLIPELDFKTKFNTTVFPDGTVKDAIRLEHGWWESKDQYDKLDEEIEKKLGKGYPNAIVRFMIESADYLTHKHFGKLLSDPGVEILDPCTGTGTYVTELIEYLPADKLEHKYKHEIHCNEIAILPYYIANLNIEFTYQQKMGKYEEFKNICLVDTLDHCTTEGHQFDLFAMSVQNTARIQQQNEKTISVIIGNPPYNAHQENFNQRNANRLYKGIDKAIKETYIKEGTAQNQIVVYDMYTRFFRWASDRLGQNGIIAFITNRSFVDAKAFDGFRKCVEREFDHIYIVDIGGDIRAGDTSGNIFDIKLGVAVMFLVRKRKETK